MPTQKFRVRGLRPADEESVSQRVREMDGVFVAALNHRDQCAEVEFADDRASIAEMRAAIAALGYDAEPAG